MYYADDSPYQYSADFRRGKGHDLRPSRGVDILNIGWLSREHPFPKGQATQPFLHWLFRFCSRPRALTMGHHICEFCDASDRRQGMTVEEEDGVRIELGSGEIHVPASDERIYVAPDLIYHYVIAHGYLPPQDFIDALVRWGENPLWALGIGLRLRWKGQVVIRPGSPRRHR